MPSYMGKFHCIGGECEDTCCAGWKITIDESSYLKYKKTKSKTVQRKINGNLVLIKKELRNSKNYAYFKMDPLNRCPMLTEGGWCSIQHELGENALSPVCKTYPRIVNVVDNQIEVSGVLSCPEIARLVLLNDKIMEFDEVEYSDCSDLVVDNRKKSVRDDVSYFWPIRIFSIEIVQNRSMALCDRLIVLGLFVNRIYEEKERLDQQRLINIINEYRAKMEDLNYLNSIKNINISLEFQTKILLEITNYRLLHGKIYDRYSEVFECMIKGYGITDTMDNEGDIIECYLHNYHNYYYDYMKTREYILENYIVNYLFSKGYPNQINSIFEEYKTIMILYSLIKLHLVGSSGFYKELNEDVVVKTVQSFVKMTEHSKSFLANVNEILEKNGYNTIAHIATLIKDIH